MLFKKKYPSSNHRRNQSKVKSKWKRIKKSYKDYFANYESVLYHENILNDYSNF